jgi:hypothetical protein
MDTALLQQKRIADLAKVADVTLLLQDETPSNEPVTAPETRRSGQRRNLDNDRAQEAFSQQQQLLQFSAFPHAASQLKPPTP